MFGITLIVLLLILSAVIAYMGDVMGRYLGKRRVMILGMRPRRASRFITILAGITITLITIGVLLLASREARIALLGLEKLQREKKTLEEDIGKLRELAAIIEDTASTQPVVFNAKQPLLTMIIPAGLTEEEVTQRIFKGIEQIRNMLIQENLRIAKEYNIKLDYNAVEERKVLAPSGDFNRVVGLLNGSKQGKVLLIYSRLNNFLGDDLIAGFQVYDNKLVFQKNEVITSKEIDTNISRDEVLDELANLLEDVRRKAIKRGMIPNPTGGGLGVDLPLGVLFDKCNEILSKRGFATVEVVTAGDIWTLGPLKFTIEVK